MRNKQWQHTTAHLQSPNYLTEIESLCSIHEGLQIIDRLKNMYLSAFYFRISILIVAKNLPILYFFIPNYNKLLNGRYFICFLYTIKKDNYCNYPKSEQTVWIKSRIQGPVVQSVVSLTSSLRVISLTVLADSIHNILILFAEKMWVAFALLTFFQQKLSAYLRITRCKF